MKLMCSDFLWFLMNVISTYLFLEQFCQFSEGVLKFLSEAGDSIHRFSSCTHIGALKTKWKFRISLKSAYLYTSNVRWSLLMSLIQLTVHTVYDVHMARSWFSVKRSWWSRDRTSWCWVLSWTVNSWVASMTGWRRRTGHVVTWPAAVAGCRHVWARPGCRQLSTSTGRQL